MVKRKRNRKIEGQKDRTTEKQVWAVLYFKERKDCGWIFSSLTDIKTSSCERLYRRTTGRKKI